MCNKFVNCFLDYSNCLFLSVSLIINNMINFCSKSLNIFYSKKEPSAVTHLVRFFIFSSNSVYTIFYIAIYRNYYKFLFTDSLITMRGRVWEHYYSMGCFILLTRCLSSVSCISRGHLITVKLSLSS